MEIARVTELVGYWTVSGLAWDSALYYRRI